MRSVSLNIGGSGEKGFAKLNCHMRYEHEEIRDGIVGEGQDLLEEDEFRIHTISKYVIKGLEHREITQASLHKQQKQPQRSVVCWERFLPIRSLKVLLVETDEPTRSVVSALLRNCGYEVTAVSNGVQAWEILQDLTNHIDIVLTEVVMPGFSLLCKIMNHKTCKNIPVIIMSSHDSMGLVFKCLSNGAVDFLVKPIRKNELKNLWQHVWRRRHSSSGSGTGNESGSESGIYVQKFQKSNAVDNYDNSTSCNDVADSVMDRSENGDRSQSSLTKQTVEVDSPDMQDQLVNYPNSTCAKDVHPAGGHERVPIAAKRDCLEHDEKLLDIVAMGKDLEIGLPRIAQHDYENKKTSANLLTRELEMMPESIFNKENEQLYTGILELYSENPIGSLGAQCANRAGLTTNCNRPHVESIDVGAPNHVSKVSGFEDKTTSEPKDTPFLELSLKKQRVGDVGITIHDEHNIVRHSNMSAFFRRTAASIANQSGIIRRSSLLINKSKEMKMESSHEHLSIQSNHKDMSSTKPAALDEKATSTSTTRYLHSAFQPVHNSCICPPLQFMPKKIDDVEAKASVTQPRHPHQKVHVQHHYHHYHHYHHRHVNKMQQQQTVPDHEDVPLDITAATLQCVSSNEIDGPIDSSGGNCSLNGSVSGSNHGSNHPNESLKDLNAGLKNTEIDIGLTIKSGNGGTSCTGSGIDQNRLAALTKFRQKRKQRCFDKKVRYQSRKRLAEKRPRVRGQFVRQRVHGNTNEDSNA